MFKISIIPVLLTLSINLFSANKIDMVFVSNLTVTVSDNRVLLKWENPENFKENLCIYRSKEVIDSSDKLKNSEKVAILTNQEEKYIDVFTDENVFYAVLINKKETDTDYLVFIPYRNYTRTKLSKDTSVSMEKFYITSCKSTSNKTSIIIEWDYRTDSLGTAKIVIYRNTEPIIDEEKLDSSIKLASIGIDSKIYVDIPIAGINYYYAVFMENDKNKEFDVNVSYTINPVFIEKREASIDNFSSENFIPLPLLTLQNDPTNGKRFNDPQILKNPRKIEYDEKISKIIKDMKKLNKKQFDEVISDNKQKAKKLDFRLLNDEDIFHTIEYSNEYSNIISLLKKTDYKTALDLITELLYETIPEEMKSRIAYYAGLIYYLNEEYYRSYLYLVLSYDSYKLETMPYIDSIYFIIFPTLDR